MYLKDVQRQVERAQSYLLKMETYPSIPVDPETLADWEALREELKKFVAAPAATWEGGSFQAMVAVYETLTLLWIEFGGSRRAQRQAEQKRQEQAALEAVTYEVQLWRGTKFAAPHRIARTTVDEWYSRPGFSVRVEPYQPKASGSFDTNPGTGHPSGGYTVTTKAIGAELPEGTVKSKRIVARPVEGRVVEYLMKKRGVRAEHKYRRGVRAADIRSQLEVNADTLSPEKAQELREELDSLVRVGI